MINVFDTSALIYDPQLILNGYPGEDIIIPMTVLREIDHIKSIREHPGSSAREILRCIDILREEGNISEGVEREVGGTLRIELNNIHDDNDLLPPHAKVESNDDKIILVTKNIAHHHPDEKVTLITQDRSMSIIAELWGVDSKRHEVLDKDDTLPKGVQFLEVEQDTLSDLYSPSGVAFVDADIPVNTGVVLRNGSSSGIGVSDGDGGVYRIYDGINLHGIQPRGVEQIIAANLMLGAHLGCDDREFLGSLSGRAGAGKTILALAAGMHRIMEKNDYNEIIIFRPTEPVGRDLGYLPGNLDEKMKPWSAAIEDVLEAMNIKGTGAAVASKDNSTLKNLDSIISIESSNFVRGRTLRNKWVIIEEAQNYEPVVLRTLLSRVGEGSAAILTWDPSQVDNAYLRKNEAEGPESVLRGLLGDPMVWHVELHNPERGGVSAIIN